MTTTATTPGRRKPYAKLPDPPKTPDMLQHKHISHTHTMLERRFGSPSTLVSGSGYLRRDARDRRGYLVPDCIIAFGVDAEAIESANGYTVSDVGKPPEFVLEIASETTGARDYTVKRDGYRDLGAGEYWRFDASGGLYHDRPLAGDALVDGEYVPIEIHHESDGVIWGYSPILNLNLCWDRGRLRFYDPERGEYLRNLPEAEERAVRAEERAEFERAVRAEAEERAESERAARADAEERAARAEAELERIRESL